ncbi:MAG TPA: septal ring lytic transglycosylase RlpA family protein [Puia sp.]|jgi:rare lipoprotein A
MPKRLKTGLFAYLLFPMAVFGREEGPLRDSVPHKKHVSIKDNDPPAAQGHHKAAAVKVQYGVASYYADKFEGRKTYTDEIFSQKKLTAASNTLPMHVWVRVTNLRNKRTVVVRINDKMHPHNRRLIDLSQAAAARLGYKGRGLTRVRIDVLGRKKPAEADAAAVTKDE